MPQWYIIAGPNGAGKTTAAYKLLPDIINVREFVNADEIARGISPFNPESVAIQAGKIMLQRIDELINHRISFAIETTLTTIGYLSTIEKAKQAGYEITLFYIWLDNADLAIERVNDRVTLGGHSIPVHVIQRRYLKGIKNLPKFMNVVKDWFIFDNSGSNYIEVAKKENGVEEITNFDLFTKIIGNVAG